MHLSLSSLRTANKERLPQFKNKHGGLAHSKTDGSDWNPAQWLQALFGEIGEYAEVRLAYETGAISVEEYSEKAAKELADVQTYLDINAARALDSVPALMDPNSADAAQRLMVVLSILGQYANFRKKLDRGDLDLEQFEAYATTLLNDAIYGIRQLMVNGPATTVIEAHPDGVDLSEATVDKFNEVSLRVGSTVRLRRHADIDEALPFVLFKVGDMVRVFGVGGAGLNLMLVKHVDERGCEPRYTGETYDGRVITVPDSQCVPSARGDIARWNACHPLRLERVR